jgi:hypothetical protein
MTASIAASIAPTSSSTALRCGLLGVIAMSPSPLDSTQRRTVRRQWMRRGDNADQAQGLTFEVFRCATRGLPPAVQLAVFLSLPEQRQRQAWSSLRVELDAAHDLASPA